MVRRILPLLALVGACTDQVGGLQGAALGDAGPTAFDAGAPDAATGSASVFDPSALPVAGTALTVFAPDVGARPVMQGPWHSLVWTGSRYVVVWTENRGIAGIVVAAAQIDPETGAVGEEVVLSPFSGDPDYAEPRNPVALATRVGALVAWTAEGSAWVAQLDDQGQPTARGILMGTTSDLQLQWLEDAAGPRLVARPARSSRQPVSWTRTVTPTGVPEWWEGGLSSQLGFVMGPNDRVFQLISQRNAGGTDQLFLGEWSWDMEMSTSGQVYTADSAAFTSAVATIDALWATVWDYDAGRLLVSLLEGAPQVFTTVGDPGLNRTGLAAEPGGRRLVLVHEEGRTPSGNLPASLELQAFDGRLGTRNRVAPPGCIEGWQVAARSDRVGISWVDSCNQRVLRFAEVRGAQF